LCCTYLRIGAPDGSDWKQAWVTCRHCLGRKCSIYDRRPEPCRQFECLWLAETFIPKKFRPDKVNAFLVASKEGNAFIAHCREKDKLELTRGQSRFSKYLLGLASANPVVVLTEKSAEPIGAYAKRIDVTLV
jgi:Fe-S-cluster containining protein